MDFKKSKKYLLMGHRTNEGVAKIAPMIFCNALICAINLHYDLICLPN